MLHMTLILLTGAPASGKSSIADALSEKLKIDKISKDEFKIKLFERYGFQNHTEKKKLSLQGEEKMYHAIAEHLQNGKSLIVDNNFKSFDTIRQLRANAPTCKVICVELMAEPSILAERYNDRIQMKNRHPALYTLDVFPITPESHFHPILKPEDVIRIQQDVTEAVYGDAVLKIPTNQIEQNFDLIIKRLMEFICAEMESDKK